MRRVERNEDMSPNGRLTVIQQDDGDVIVGIVPNSMEDARRHYVQSVEFCSVGSGGGRSPRTLEALRALMDAIEADNRAWPITDGAGSL